MTRSGFSPGDMQWIGQLTAPTQRATASAVPDSEALRRAALQASWRRDRWVSRRRLAWRWTLFYLQAHGWLLLAVALLWGGWAVWRTSGGAALTWPLAWPPVLARWTSPTAPAAPPPPVPAAAPRLADPPPADGLQIPPLRLDAGPLFTPAPTAPTPSTPGAADEAPLTGLKFESSIQRKEM